ncbi:unnamed protein product [Closterium sp. Yama58-4]|nr:unnamed protein product [Closterium sp. Yama58-4]
MPGNYAAVPPVASANRPPFGTDITDGSGAPGARGGVTTGGGGFNSADSAPLKPLANVKLRLGTNEDASQLMPEIYRVASAARGAESGAHVTAENAERSLRIVRATDNFSNANLLGRGAFGQVYKGRVLGCNMAIKRLQGGGWQGPNEYSMEVEVLSRMRHPHIVPLMGHCPDPNAMCILYEYLPGGSLQEYLAASARSGSVAGGVGLGDGSRSSAVFLGTGSGLSSGSVASSVAGLVAAGPMNQVLRQPLAWYDRVRILSEVSGALLYLHQHSPPIAHRDLKPDNVLLDGNRMSKLGDVGLARLIAEDDYNVTARVQGTVGYIDPEEVATCEISVLSDIYAFGLIVLQLLMGEPQVKQVHRLLTDTAAKVDAEKRRAGRVGGVCSEPWSAAVDAVLARLDKSGGEWRADVARQLAVIGVRCADRARARRPALEREVQPVLMRLEEEVRREGEKGRTDVDNQLLCPISQKRMTDPVVAADGFTYERYMIEQWLERNNTSPITGQPFPHRLLTPNNTLRMLLASHAQLSLPTKLSLLVRFGCVPNRRTFTPIDGLAPLLEWRWYLRPPPLIPHPSFVTMDSHHNPDAVMTDEQLAAGDDTLTDLGDYVLEDLPDGVPPELNEEPAAKKQCGEGTSAGAEANASTATTPAPQPMQRSNSSGSSAATAPSASRSSVPPRPRSAPPSRPQPPVQEAAVEQPSAGPAANLSLSVRYRNLRRHRSSVGTELRSLRRNPLSLVTVMFPECSEEVRESILSRIAAALPGSAAFNGAVPQFDAAAGEPLRLPRRTYHRHIYSWTSAADARIFRGLFATPFLTRFNNSRPIEVKIYVDPYPEFSAAKARGDTYAVVRNVPLGVQPEDLRETLLRGKTEDDLPWLADLLHFHRLKDPYDDSAYSQMLGLPVAAEGDSAFELISAHASTAAFKKDPGLLLIGMDLDVEVWACSICDFVCGIALDSAMFHLTSEQHRNRLQDPAHQNVSKDKYGAWKAETLVQHHRIKALLQRPWWRTLFSAALDSPTSSAGTIVAGDFNAVCSAEDRNRPPLAHETSEGVILSAALQRHALADSFRLSYPNEPMFSFFAIPRTLPRDPPPTASRLDRIYVPSSLTSRVLDAQYASASKELTDHDLAPSCFIRCEAPNLAHRPWRLPHALLQRPHTAQIVSTACLDLPPAIHGAAWDAWKLSLCNKLKAFGRQERIRTKKTSEHLQNLVSHLRIALAVNPTDSDTAEQLRVVSQQFERYEASRAADIALKAKLKVEGPREMGISSLLVGINSRINASLVTSLQSPTGELVSELPAMCELCTAYFRNLYSTSHPVRPDDKFWTHLPPSLIPPNITHRLSQPFSMAEITAAIKKRPRGKTPGPDGLPGELYRSFHTKFSPAIHSSPTALPPSMLQGRTVLIPKKGDATVLDNLCPITLMNSDYKILAICLAARLQPLLPSLIHHSQAAFIKSRKIGDTLNDTLDIFDWATTQNTPLLALKVDIRKAYDLVDREFMLSCLAFLGLPPPFIQWVRLMHTGTTTWISVNNLCGPAIPVRSGVRQGCPLAPLLFLGVIEIFHRYSSHFLPGFPISRTQHRLMACYADDVTIFLNSDQELQTASHILLSFAAVSGEHPNRAKCAILPFNIPPASVTYAGSIPIRGEADFERILGIHVGLSGRSEVTWERAQTQISRSASFLANLHASSTCRKNLSNIFLNSTLSFPGRFQPPPDPSIHAIDAVPADMNAPPHHAYEVEAVLSETSFQAYARRVDSVGRISKDVEARCLLSCRDFVQVYVVDRWLGGTFCSGAGLAARFEILQDDAPSLAAIRNLAYTQQPLPHAQRWINILPDPGPCLIPTLTHAFLTEQPSSQRDVLFRLYSRALPSGSRFLYAADKGICGGCNRGVVEDLPHLFFECGVAQPITEALQRSARSHLGISTSAALTLFPLASAAGQAIAEKENCDFGGPKVFMRKDCGFLARSVQKTTTPNRNFPYIVGVPEHWRQKVNRK